MANQQKTNLGATVLRDGVEFRLWAPFAKSVAVSGVFNNWGETGLKRETDTDGYWSGIVPGVVAGQEYKYIITTSDNQILRKNDPRAKQITDSDEGCSIVTSNKPFDWGKKAIAYKSPKINQQIIYEMHIGTFNRPDPGTIGTFYTAIDKLDYLDQLGINMIELMPITSMATSNGWGYAPNYIFSIENSYGGRYGFFEFVKACHEHNIGIIVDVVYNHFFTKTDLWQFDGWSENNRGGIYFYNDDRGDTPWGARPDYGRSEVRQFLLDNVAMWINEYKVDGLRVDSTIYMRNTAGQNNDPIHDISEAYSLLKDITYLAHKINPSSIVIAEDSASNSTITDKTGLGFDAQWELGFPHALRDGLGIDRPLSLDGLSYELNHRYNNHVFSSIIFSDSHDTAANGSVRLDEAIQPGNPDSKIARQKSLLADCITLTAPGIPMILQGEEFMQGGSFNDWQMLDWQKTNRFSGIVLAHSHLIKLRLNAYNNTAGLLGENSNLFLLDKTNLIIGYNRWQNGGPNDDTVIIANFNFKPIINYELTLPDSGTYRVRFNSSWNGYSSDFDNYNFDIIIADQANKKAVISLPAYSAVVLSQD